MIRSPMLVYVRARDADILGVERGRHSGTRAPIPDLGGLPASNTRSDTLRRRWLKVIFDVAVVDTNISLRTGRLG